MFEQQIGELIAGMEFMKTQMAENKTDHVEMRNAISELNVWRVKVVATSSIIGSIFGAIVSVVIAKF